MDLGTMDTCAPVSMHQVSSWSCILSLTRHPRLDETVLGWEACSALDVLEQVGVVTPPTNVGKSRPQFRELGLPC